MTTNKTTLISLDTSSTITGYAVFENAILKTSGIFDYKKIKNIEDRLEPMSQSIVKLLKDYNPSIIVIERPPLARDPQTLINLAEIVGCVKGWAITKNIEKSFAVDYIEYAPNTWRKLVADKDENIPIKREICKPWDIEKVQKLFNLKAVDDNEADAILIGQARINEFNILIKTLSNH